MITKNQVAEVLITGMATDGNGVGRIDGMAVFVPFSAVGDLLEVQIVKTAANYCYGRINRIIEPSPDRIESDCPAFGKCGGCSFRHIDYNSELSIKANWVKENLRRIGGVAVDEVEIVPSPLTEGYRNKAQLPVTRLDDKIIAGFYALRSHRVIPCNDCKLQPEVFQKITEAVLKWAETYNIEPYDEETNRGVLRHIYLRNAEATGEVMVCLVATTTPAHIGQLVTKLLGACPQIVSFTININKEQTNVILGKSIRTVYGKDYITDKLCGMDFDISPMSFFQVNRQGAEVLYGIAGDFADLSDSDTLIDLYCGTGTIGLSLAKKAGKLIGIEIIPQAVENAKVSATKAGITNAEFICGDAGTAAAELAERELKADVVILDPPRKGCDEQTIASVCQMEPKRIVMVSCNSSTMARDVKRFQELGYELTKIKAVDMFPRTAHVESVVLMSRV